MSHFTLAVKKRPNERAVTKEINDVEWSGRHSVVENEVLLEMVEQKPSTGIVGKTWF